MIFFFLIHLCILQMGVTVLSGILTKEDPIQEAGRTGRRIPKISSGVGWAVVWNNSSMRPVQKTGDTEIIP